MVIAALPGEAESGLSEMLAGNDGGPPAALTRSAMISAPTGVPRPVAQSYPVYAL